MGQMTGERNMQIFWPISTQNSIPPKQKYASGASGQSQYESVFSFDLFPKIENSKSTSTISNMSIKAILLFCQSSNKYTKWMIQNLLHT